MFYAPLMGRHHPTHTTSKDARSIAREARTDVQLLEQDVERLLMITEALWNILKEKHGYDDNELIRRIGEIDFRDGRLDGRKAAAPPRQCPHCHRILIKKRPFCMYCGKPVARNPFER